MDSSHYIKVMLSIFDFKQIVMLVDKSNVDTFCSIPNTINGNVEVPIINDECVTKLQELRDTPIMCSVPLVSLLKFKAPIMVTPSSSSCESSCIIVTCNNPIQSVETEQTSIPHDESTSMLKYVLTNHSTPASVIILEEGFNKLKNSVSIPTVQLHISSKEELDNNIPQFVPESTSRPATLKIGAVRTLQNKATEARNLSKLKTKLKTASPCQDTCNSTREMNCDLKNEDGDVNNAVNDPEVVSEKAVIVVKDSGGNFLCQLCPYKAKHPSEVEEHQVVHTQENKHTCKLCGKKFRWKNGLSKHERLHSSNWKCQSCPKVFSSQRALNHHTYSYHRDDGRGFKCKECGLNCKYESILKRHIITHSKPKECQVFQKESFLCEQCGRAYMNRTSLRDHMNTHTGERPYVCHLCGKMFERKDTYNRHVNIFHEQKLPEKKQCDVCGEVFNHNHKLKLHTIIKHTDERPFKCQQCDQTYRSASNLKAHENMHLGIKPFSCKFCGRTFLNSCNKAKHERRHSTVRPYQCVTCNKAFFEKQELSRHNQKHHNEDPKASFRNYS